jgi:dolichyl-phosphate beta-glucosyltransferase
MAIPRRNYLKRPQLPADENPGKKEQEPGALNMTALAIPYRIGRTECTASPVLLSIVIPTRNECERMTDLLGRISRYLLLQPFRSEIILVDDGSTDGTADAALSVWDTLADRSDGIEIRVLRSDRHRGKGHCVRQGMLNARGEWILCTDPDLATPIDQLDRLFAAAREGADIALGARRTTPPPGTPRRPWDSVTAAFSRVLGTLRGYPDAPCGLRLYHRSAARTIASLQHTRRRSFEAEHLLLADRLGYQVARVGVNCSRHPFEALRPRANAVAAIWDFLHLRWVHRRLGQTGRSLPPAQSPGTIRIGDLLYQTNLSWWPRSSR